MVRMAARVVTFALLAIGATLGYFAHAAPTRADATFSPSGVDSTGRHDETVALQTLIDNLPDGSTLAFPAGGKYRIEGTLHVKRKNNLTIDGNSSLFFATTTGNRTRSQWSFEGGSNIIVHDVIVKGANPHAGVGTAAYVASLEAQHAFQIVSTNGIELDHVSATDVYGDFVYVGLQAGGFAKNVYIHDSIFSRNGRQGISVTGADGVRIVRNTISDTRRATFDLEPNGPSWGVFNVDIEHNTIGAGRLLLLASGGIGPVSHITFAHNVIHRGAIMLVRDSKGGRRGPFTISDNVATVGWGGPAGNGVLNFHNVDGLTVIGNTMPLQARRGDYGVTATDSCNVVVTSNTFPNAVAPASVTPGPACSSGGGILPSPPVTSPTTTGSAAPTHQTSSAPAPTRTATPSPSPTAPSPAATHTAGPVTRPTTFAPTPTTSSRKSLPVVLPRSFTTPTPRSTSHHSSSPPKQNTVAAEAKAKAARASAKMLDRTLAAEPPPRAAIAITSDTSQPGMMLIVGALLAAAVAGLVGFRPTAIASPTCANTARHRSGRTTIGGAVDVLPRHVARRGSGAPTHGPAL